MRVEVPQLNGLKVFVETEPTVSGDGTVIYVVCDGHRIGFRFSGHDKWEGVRPGYEIHGGADDNGFYDRLIVERVGRKQ